MSRSVSRRSSPSRPPIRPTPWSSSSRSAGSDPLQPPSLCSAGPGGDRALVVLGRRRPARWRASSRVSRAGAARKRPASARRRRRLSSARAASRARAACARACPAGRSGSEELVRLEAVQLGLAPRCSSTKRWMRSRASGGTCGDSMAAPGPPRGRACAGGRPGSRARGRPGAARSAGARARARRRGVLRVDQQPHPGEHVAHLRPLEEAAGGSPRARGSSRASPGGAGAISEPDTPKDTGRGAGPAGVAGAGLRSVGGRRRLGRSAADRRAGRRLAPFGACARAGRAAGARLRRARRAATADSAAAELPRLEVVDRPAWIAANLRTMRPMLGRSPSAPGTSAGACSAARCAPPRRDARRTGGGAHGHALPARARPVRPRTAGRVSAAEAAAARPEPRPGRAQPRVDRDELVLWVTIHEITHAVQFSGAPWLREHLGGMLTELIEGLQLARPRTVARMAHPSCPAWASCAS